MSLAPEIIGKWDNFGRFSRSWQMILEQSFQVPIRLSLEQLASVGLDLMECGQRESRLHLKQRVNKQWDFKDYFLDSPTYQQKIFTLRLVSFTYGPLPEDWQFWFTDVMDNSLSGVLAYGRPSRTRDARSMERIC
jgi:hypothetical protein